MLKLIFELVVVFFGVYGAFQLNQWAEYRKNRERELIYIKNMHEELIEDEHRLDDLIIDYYAKKNRKLGELTNLARKKGSVLEITEIIRRDMLSVKTFQTRFNTWRTLIESGDIKLISSIKIKTLATELEIKYANVAEQTKMVEDFILNKVMEFVLKEMDINIWLTFVNKNAPHTQYFINLASTFQLEIVKLSILLKMAQTACVNLKAEIEKELIGIKD